MLDFQFWLDEIFGAAFKSGNWGYPQKIYDSFPNKKI